MNDEGRRVVGSKKGKEGEREEEMKCKREVRKEGKRRKGL